jgi:hypothetical protein
LTEISRDQYEISPAIMPDSSPAPAGPGGLAELTISMTSAGLPDVGAAPLLPVSFADSAALSPASSDAFALLMSLAVPDQPTAAAPAFRLPARRPDSRQPSRAGAS